MLFRAAALAAGCAAASCGSDATTAAPATATVTAAGGASGAAPPTTAVPHSNHDPFHAGQLGMVGRWHLEVAREGAAALRLWVTDEVRAPVKTARASGTVELSLDDKPLGTLTLAPAADGESFGAAAAVPLAGTVLASFSLRVDGEAVAMDFSLPPPGAAPVPAAPGADHVHAAPHGGLVHTAGDYHLELLASATGVTVWVLDEHLAAVPAAGKSGHVDVLPRAGDKLGAALAPDAAGAALGAALPLGAASAAGYVAVVTVTWEGTALPPTRFEIAATAAPAPAP